MMDFLIAIVATEAITEAIFKAAPLQGIRFWLIEKTPWLRSEIMGHLLECKYCVSAWVGAIMAAIYMTVIDIPVMRWFLLAMTIHRISNYLHLPISYLRDRQLDIRVSRNRRAGHGMG